MHVSFFVMGSREAITPTLKGFFLTEPNKKWLMSIPISTFFVIDLPNFTAYRINLLMSRLEEPMQEKSLLPQSKQSNIQID